MNDYNMHVFPDVRKGDDSFFGLIVGAKGSGKSCLLIDLLQSVWSKSFDLVVIVSPTFSLQHISHEVEGSKFVIISEFRMSIIETLKDLQKEKIEKQQSYQENKTLEVAYQDPLQNSGPPRDHHVLLVFDDIGSLGKEGKLALQMANLAFVVRHFRISIIELCQRATLASTSLSSQADFWIFFAEQNPNERINIFKRIGFTHKQSFWNTFDHETGEVRSWIGIRKIAGRNFFFNIQGLL
jgi:hypothetical protein